MVNEQRFCLGWWESSGEEVIIDYDTWMTYQLDIERIFL